DGFEIGTLHHPEHLAHEFENRKTDFHTEVKRFPCQFPLLCKVFCQAHISRRSILDVKEVADEMAVASDEKAFVTQCGLNDPRYGATEVQVASSEEIAAPGDDDR